MRYFVSGATSSIGRVLVKELYARGETVNALVRKTSRNLDDIRFSGVEFIYGDVNDIESIENGMKGCERVCHLAAMVGSDSPDDQWWKVNKEGTQNVIQAAIKNDVRSYVQVSSISVLMPTQIGEMADESRTVDTTQYFNIYQKTKRAADDEVRNACNKLSAKIVYPGYGYGYSFASSHPGMTDQTLLRMAANKPAAIMGSGKNRLFISYYSDTAKGIILTHENGIAGDDYILGNGNYTLPQIWNVIASILGKEPPKRRVPIDMLKTINSIKKMISGKTLFPQDFFDMVGRDWCFSNEKAKRILKFEPGSFEKTMTETWLEWCNNNKTY